MLGFKTCLQVDKVAVKMDWRNTASVCFRTNCSVVCKETSHTCVCTSDSNVGEAVFGFFPYVGLVIE